jgi:hypothetical protein
MILLVGIAALLAVSAWRGAARERRFRHQAEAWIRSTSTVFRDGGSQK